MLRRDLLLKAGAASGWLALGASGAAWAAVGEPTGTAPRRLVVVFLRGAADGLSVVVPYGDAAYYQARGSIALAKPGAEGGVLDLDGHFGLHPSLAPLMPLWQAGKLGFVHASGSPDATRSHFDAQDYMESATPGRKATPDGWMNRALGALPELARATPARAVSIGAVMPRIYAGRHPVANIASGQAATKPTVLDRPAVKSAFDQLYADDSDKTARAYKASQQAHQEVMAALEEGKEDTASLSAQMLAANNGAPLPNGFPDDAARLAKLMRNDGRVQLAFLALGGWDTHANQGNARGQLANRLAPLGTGLAALANGLGPVFNDTAVVVMSEFGRTVNQNGNGGTDHGHGNVMWVMGGNVAGGKVLGAWPGLDKSALYEGRDLAVTTDFRQVLAGVLERHMRLSDGQLADVFPAFTGGASPALFRA
jgi:uncharacterized protein (DUF1501 family)